MKGVIEEMTGSRTSEKVMTKLANAGEGEKSCYLGCSCSSSGEK
jgi:hypothetical protein